MKSDQEKWNQKFAQRIHLLDPEPFLLKKIEALPGKSLLDLACGDGRNAVHFSRLGFIVTAVDISDVGLGKIDSQAKQESLKIELIQADFDDLSFLGQLKKYDNVILNHYKPSQQLWSKIHALLNDHGRIFLCAFNEQHHQTYNFPNEFCLQPQEFLTANPHLYCEHYASFFEDERHLDGYIFSPALF